VATERPIDTKEVADMLGVTPRTVIRLAERGEIIGFKVGDVWRFYRRDIEDYIEEQKRKQQKDS
jgi:excisionase family DNA binding protein